MELEIHLLNDETKGKRRRTSRFIVVPAVVAAEALEATIERVID